MKFKSGSFQHTNFLTRKNLKNKIKEKDVKKFKKSVLKKILLKYKKYVLKLFWNILVLKIIRHLHLRSSYCDLVI